MLQEGFPVEHLEIIDTSPKDLKKNTSIVSFRNLIQAVRILFLFYRRVRQVDAVIIFGSDENTLYHLFIWWFIGPILPTAGLASSLVPGFWGLRHANGLIVETELLQRSFASILGQWVDYIPAYRTILGDSTMDLARDGATENVSSTQPLRLLFVAWIREEKGVSVLLKALRILDRETQSLVQCDLYSPIVPHYAARFHAELAQTSTASYQGILDADQVITTMQQYDALVFPTFYQGEGQLGVVIESMMAGLPVIATHFRSVPEVVTDYVNGLLIEPKHVDDLVQAILLLDHDRALLRRLGEQNWQQRVYYDAGVIIPQLIDIIRTGDHEA